MFEWIAFGIWVLAGLLVLIINKEVSRFQYAVCWLVLLVHLFGNGMGW